MIKLRLKNADGAYTEVEAELNVPSGYRRDELLKEARRGTKAMNNLKRSIDAQINNMKLKEYKDVAYMEHISGAELTELRKTDLKSVIRYETMKDLISEMETEGLYELQDLLYKSLYDQAKISIKCNAIGKSDWESQEFWLDQDLRELQSAIDSFRKTIPGYRSVNGTDAKEILRSAPAQGELGTSEKGEAKEVAVSE